MSRASNDVLLAIFGLLTVLAADRLRRVCVLWDALCKTLSRDEWAVALRATSRGLMLPVFIYWGFGQRTRTLAVFDGATGVWTTKSLFTHHEYYLLELPW